MRVCVPRAMGGEKDREARLRVLEGVVRKKCAELPGEGVRRDSLETWGQAAFALRAVTVREHIDTLVRIGRLIESEGLLYDRDHVPAGVPPPPPPTLEAYRNGNETRGQAGKNG